MNLTSDLICQRSLNAAREEVLGHAHYEMGAKGEYDMIHVVITW